MEFLDENPPLSKGILCISGAIWGESPGVICRVEDPGRGYDMALGLPLESGLRLGLSFLKHSASVSSGRSATWEAWDFSSLASLEVSAGVNAGFPNQHRLRSPICFPISVRAAYGHELPGASQKCGIFGGGSFQVALRQRPEEHQPFCPPPPPRLIIFRSGPFAGWFRILTNRKQTI